MKSVSIESKLFLYIESLYLPLNLFEDKAQCEFYVLNVPRLTYKLQILLQRYLYRCENKKISISFSFIIDEIIFAIDL